MRSLIRFDSNGYSSSWDLAPSAGDTLLRCDPVDRRTALIISGHEHRSWADPLAALSWLAQMAAQEEPGVRWAGYLSYDLGRLFEDIHAIRDLRLPLFCFARCQSPSTARSRARASEARRQDNPLPQRDFSREKYCSAVKRAIEYIRAGDVFQVNLAQCLSLALPADPIDIADRLRRMTPARYGAFLDFDDHAVVSNSPELFFRITPGRRIITRPIKGTRPRSPGMEQELENSAKDQAELNMIIDLERNDLGRVCETGSVRVTQQRVIEEHPTVYHGAATIEGKLKQDVSFIDLLRAIFPGGSITGAPKIRAMQIIDELESATRGPYCGAIGYLAPGGAMEFNIAIRTLIVKDGIGHVHVGAGIVADSDPVAEYEETLVKARAIFAALNIPLPQ